eukprot:scaffold60779_cov37-Tisochrysis_lutea.AAC.2
MESYRIDIARTAVMISGEPHEGSRESGGGARPPSMATNHEISWPGPRATAATPPRPQRPDFYVANKRKRKLEVEQILTLTLSGMYWDSRQKAFNQSD